ncbi:hypothetical protein [Actinomadura sp. NBRC 104425]|uniref:hypothetical protein n=1 Tax=Actinomadura sp. NBRC 104425 TaxID=3032204 RepID=UPI0025523CC5|nr:hypothetical protein [Actinomadura sp. NBRC 104425]
MTAVLPAVLLLVAALSGCDVMKRISEGAYRNAVADGAAVELGERGVRLRGRLSCTTRAGRPESVMRIRCTGRTAEGAPVVVAGVATEADTRRPREHYVITVGGRSVMTADCLGRACT